MDTILYNGNIETMAGLKASAIAIQGGRIAYIGGDVEALSLANLSTKVIDLRGALALPGFTDSHSHMINTAQGLSRADLRSAKSVDDVVKLGIEYLSGRGLAPGEWVLGFGFNHNSFDDPKLPLKEDLDKISSSNPIIFSRVCGHIATVNSKAIEMLGLTIETKVHGGALDFENGQLTGVLRENAISLAYDSMPKLDSFQAEGLLALASSEMAKTGITSAHSDDLSKVSFSDLKKAADSLINKGMLKVRVYEECQGPTLEAIEALKGLGLKSGVGDSDFSVVNVKILADGSLGAGTAYLREPYQDSPNEKGIPIYTQDELDSLFEACQQADFAVACHCIGDGALEMFLNAAEKAISQNPKPLRHRVVHCQIGSIELYERMASLNIGADIQPPFTATDAPIVEMRVGIERAKQSYAWKTLLDLGVRLAGGSDTPIESFDPLWGIYCAATRLDGAGSPCFMPEERLTVMDAVRLYTQGPAYFSNSLSDAGTLETGKYADLVVLDQDIFAISPENIKDAKALLTIKGGQVTYSNGELA